jgi:phage tail sheath protein FI
MLQLKYPGVYTQEIPSGVRTVSGAPTSVALFVGPTRGGIDARPIRILNFGDFERGFGGLTQTSILSYSVLHFFANGGGEAFVIRVPAKNSKAAKTALKRDDGGAVESLTLTALSSGAASSDIFVEIDPFGNGANPFSTTPAADKRQFNVTFLDRLTGRVERFANISTSSTNARFASTVANDPATGSKLVKIDVASAAVDKEGPQASGTIYKLGTPAAAGTFSSDIELRLTVAVLNADGTANTAGSLTNLPVKVFRNGDAKPTSTLELVTRLAAALNAEIRATQANTDLMEGVTIEAASFVEGSNTFIRLRTSPPGATRTTKRLLDATVTIADPAAGTSFLTTYGLPGTPTSVNPSRYQLGATYPSSSQIFGTPVPGADGDLNGQPDSNVFKQAVMDLATPDAFFNILCLPDLVRPATNDPNALHHTNAMSVYAEAARVCLIKHAFLLLDPPPNVTSVGAAESWKTLTITFQSNHAAAYFPNIRVDDPLVPGSIRSHPPSGAVAGVFARTDGQFGVWQAPAGVEASLSGVYGPSVVMSDDEQGLLNPIAVNCIRQFPIFGTVSFGSRTVDGSNALASEWKYIPVRRTASYILRSLSEALRWAVHKPNGEQLWSQLRINTTAFMQGLFRQGAFKGVSSRDAYFVLCDASTTSADDINNGVVNIVIGFAPLKPAEFVVISLRQIVQPTV